MKFPAEEVAATPLAIIGMGKSGARELNYLSDVDVIFVTDGSDRQVDIATALARETMRAIAELAVEPPLWEVDANLRPEGKDGALVRTLESHLAYYQRWAKSWEFQALLKARPLAGDRELGERYVDGVAPLVWSSATRENFVESVQGMRERVTAHIPPDEVDIQLKLGPGGLRDVEFTIQLLQLVHGHADPGVRQRSTLDALLALAESGYIGRVEAAEFARDYRFLRLLEHRIQLSRMRRTHLMPRDEQQLRVLARASGVATSADGVIAAWQKVKHEVRTLHERLFYRPLLSAVAALPDDGYTLTSEQAEARLAAIGFRDARGALHHIAALTAGVSRRAQIQRNLLPVMLQWFAEGADPDGGLLAFRRLSDDLGEAYWFLRLLRDSSGAGHRLTQVLSGSKFVGVLLERIPEAVAWLENDGELTPRLGGSAARRDSGDRRAALGRSGCRRRRPAHRPPARGAATRAGGDPGRHHRRRTRARAQRRHHSAADRSARPSCTATATASSSASSRWAATAARNSASAATPTSCTSTGRPESTTRKRSAGPRTSCTTSRASPKTCGFRSTSTSGCDPRARTGRSRVPSTRTAPTTSAGR